MSRIMNAMLKAFVPKMAIKFDDFGNYHRDNIDAMEICKEALQKKYKVFLHTDKRVIYVGGRKDEE